MASSQLHSHHHIYSPSKLSTLISRPIKPPEPELLPPPSAAVSIPFQWEEAPGKPRPCHTRSEPDTRGRKVLELPPRLVFPEPNKAHSPTTVLDGPYVGRAVSFTTSYRSPRMVGKDQWNGTFGSSRWNGYKKNRRHEFGGSIDFSNDFTFWDDCGFEATSANSSAKAKKIAKIGSRGSFFSLSRSKSHLWASIYESLKQVVPWKRKQEKQRKWDFTRN